MLCNALYQDFYPRDVCIKSSSIVFLWDIFSFCGTYLLDVNLIIVLQPFIHLTLSAMYYATRFIRFYFRIEWYIGKGCSTRQKRRQKVA